MKLAFYRDCEPHLDRRQFLKLVLVAEALPNPFKEFLRRGQER